MYPSAPTTPANGASFTTPQKRRRVNTQLSQSPLAGGTGTPFASPVPPSPAESDDDGIPPIIRTLRARHNSLRGCGDYNIYTTVQTDGVAALIQVAYPLHEDGTAFTEDEAAVYFGSGGVMARVQCYCAADACEADSLASFFQADTVENAGLWFYSCASNPSRCKFYGFLRDSLRRTKPGRKTGLVTARVGPAIESTVQKWIKSFAPTEGRWRGSEAYKLFAFSYRDNTRKRLGKILASQRKQYGDYIEEDPFTYSITPASASATTSTYAGSSSLAPLIHPTPAASAPRSSPGNILLAFLIASGSHGLDKTEIDFLLDHAVITFPSQAIESMRRTSNPLARLLAADGGIPLRHWKDFQHEARTCCHQVFHVNHEGEHEALARVHEKPFEAGEGVSYFGSS